MNDSYKWNWPDGKTFAFTITDDTDASELGKIRRIYDVLEKHGLRTTKTVWPLRAAGRAITGGDSLEDESYLEWVRQLQRAGFEIALHGVADESSTRDRIELGLERFRRCFGADPSIHINHVGQRDAIYWGAARLRPPVSWLYALYRLTRGGIKEYEGHQPASPHFWGDLCRERIKYVRNLVWHDINTTKADPLFPYHDPARPYVRHWFSATYGSGIRNFVRLLQPANLGRLAAEGGACIVYTHLGTFPPDSREFAEAIARLASMNGWFVPASTLLDHLGRQRGWTDVSGCRLAFASLQMRWMGQQLIAPTG